jgi:hypothetical protein
MEGLPPPATVRHVDFRPPGSMGGARAGDAAAGAPPRRPLRLLTWNIERGYELPRVIELLQEADAGARRRRQGVGWLRRRPRLHAGGISSAPFPPLRTCYTPAPPPPPPPHPPAPGPARSQNPKDILSLQELDIGCDRSGGTDCFAAIGAALRLNGLFLCEFEELRSPLRDARSQGGGVHGNAGASRASGGRAAAGPRAPTVAGDAAPPAAHANPIDAHPAPLTPLPPSQTTVFSRFDFTGWRVLEHTHHPIDWEAPAHPLAAKEPRRGRRTTLAADVAAPGGPLRVYCTHLEVFCGILGRAWQFSDILRDVRAALPAAAAAGAGAAAAREQPQGGQQQRQQNEGGGEQQRRQPQQEEAGQVQRFAILGDLNTVGGEWGGWVGLWSGEGFNPHAPPLFPDPAPRRPPPPTDGQRCRAAVPQLLLRPAAVAVARHERGALLAAPRAIMRGCVAPAARAPSGPRRARLAPRPAYRARAPTRLAP